MSCDIYPEVTLLMLQSLDGKISTGVTNNCDFDRDLKKLNVFKNGMQCYYNIKENRNPSIMTTGKTINKMNKLNGKKEVRTVENLSYIVVDNNHLTKEDILYLINKTEESIIIITTNPNHIGNYFSNSIDDKIFIEYFKEEINFDSLFIKLKEEYNNMDKIILQGGGILNATLSRLGYIDIVEVIIVPVLIGGINTPSIINGIDNTNFEMFLTKSTFLTLISVNVLEDNFLHLIYKVNTVIL